MSRRWLAEQRSWIFKAIAVPDSQYHSISLSVYFVRIAHPVQTGLAVVWMPSCIINNSFFNKFLLFFPKLLLSEFSARPSRMYKSYYFGLNRARSREARRGSHNTNRPHILCAQPYRNIDGYIKTAGRKFVCFRWYLHSRPSPHLLPNVIYYIIKKQRHTFHSPIFVRGWCVCAMCVKCCGLNTEHWIIHDITEDRTAEKKLCVICKPLKISETIIWLSHISFTFFFLMLDAAVGRSLIFLICLMLCVVTKSVRLPLQSRHLSSESR